MSTSMTKQTSAPEPETSTNPAATYERYMVPPLFAPAAAQLIRAVIPQRRDSGGVSEPDHAVGIHNPDRLCGRFQYCGEEVLGTDVRANEVGEGIGHAKPPSTVESTLGPRVGVNQAPSIRGRFGHVTAVAIAAAFAWLPGRRPEPRREAV